MVRSEENMSLKNPVTRLRIDPGTVRLVAQRLNHYATPENEFKYRHKICDLTGGVPKSVDEAHPVHLVHKKRRAKIRLCENKNSEFDSLRKLLTGSDNGPFLRPTCVPEKVRVQIRRV
jgi:hypothetical protein